MCSEREQDSKQNDAAFYKRRSPTVQRFGKMEMHAAGPQRLRKCNRRTYIRNVVESGQAAFGCETAKADMAERGLDRPFSKISIHKLPFRPVVET